MKKLTKVEHKRIAEMKRVFKAAKCEWSAKGRQKLAELIGVHSASVYNWCVKGWARSYLVDEIFRAKRWLK